MTVSNYAATEIQRVVRGYLSRMRVNKLAEKEKELWLIKMKISATLKATCVRQKVKKRLDLEKLKELICNTVFEYETDFKEVCDLLKSKALISDYYHIWLDS